MTEDQSIKNNGGLLMYSDLNDNMHEINSNSYYSGSRDNGRSNDNAVNSCNSDESWEDLRLLLSNFHYHVDVELPTLLERTRTSEARIDMDTDTHTSHHNHGNNEISRHYFDLRRCFRNMQELLSREDLLNLLDEGDYTYCNSNGNEDNTKNDLLLLLETFVNDLVQLSSISIFDEESDNGYNHGIAASGIRELHHSLVVLAAYRFPVKATLDNDQISLLLTRVLSLIEQEASLIHKKIRMERNHCRHRGENSHAQHYARFEPLQSLLSWLNREITVERLSRGVLFDANEAAMALQIPLEFLNEAMPKYTMPSSSSTMYHSHHTILPPQIELSLRILIDLLLGALNSLVFVVVGNDDRSSSGSSTIDGTSYTNNSLSSSLREWMSTSQQHQGHDEVRAGSKLECNGHLSLLRLLDRYTLELVEETLEILRPCQRKPSKLQEFSEGQHGGRIRGEQSKLEAGQKQDRRFHQNSYNDEGNQGDAKSHDPNKAAKLMIQPRQRVVKVLQYAAMTTNAFSIMETTASGSTGDTSGTPLVFAGLSRSFWRAFARFIIEEVDCLDDIEDANAENTVDTAEECRIAATDVLFRLTKMHVQTILFDNQKKDTIDFKSGILVKSSSSSSRLFWNKTIKPRLSEEEFSIVLTTILRMLGHPNEYWTEKTQAWVASLLRIEDESDKNNPKLPADNSSGVDVASKLRKALQAALICSSYVPDTLPFEEQHRVNSSLASLLLPSPAHTHSHLLLKRNHADDCLTESLSKGIATKDKLVNDPWESFWAIRQ